MELKISEEMYGKSLVNKGNVSRILKMIEIAENGGNITIGFIGGSITQGCNSTVYEKCYVELTAEWFRKKFDKINVKHINAGVGATGSLIGVHRVERQIIACNPDLVFVDAAVNDNQEYSCREAYESLIRRLLNSKSKPAVVEVFMTMDKGLNVQEQQIQTGERYDVPMISFRNVIYDEVMKNEIRYSDVLTDEVHPNDLGHKIISELLMRFIEDVYKNDYKKGVEIKINDKVLEAPCVFGDRYIDGTILSNQEIKPSEIKGFKNYEEGFQVFHNGWKYDSCINREGKLVFQTEAKNIVLLYKKSVSDKAGKFSVKVNNKKEVLVDTFFKDGWGDYSATEILELSDEPLKYSIEINVIKEDAASEIIILGIMVSGRTTNEG